RFSATSEHSRDRAVVQRRRDSAVLQPEGVARGGTRALCRGGAGDLWQPRRNLSIAGWRDEGASRPHDSRSGDAFLAHPLPPGEPAVQPAAATLMDRILHSSRRLSVFLVGTEFFRSYGGIQYINRLLVRAFCELARNTPLDLEVFSFADGPEHFPSAREGDCAV